MAKQKSKAMRRRAVQDTAVSRTEFDQLNGAVSELAQFITGGGLTDMLKEQLGDRSAKRTEMAGQPVATTKQEEKNIALARGDAFQVNDEWDAAAREIIGSEYIDHTEVKHQRSGGIQFTVVIKRDKSNMPQFYLDQVKCDRRTRDVTEKGFDGVVEWCKLIRQNLGRGRDINQVNVKDL